MHSACFGLISLGIATGLAFLAIPAAAQNAALVGTAKDATDAVVPGVRVTLTNLQTKVTLATETDSTGNYEFAFVRPGEYSLRGERPGFKTFIQAPITVLVDERDRVDFKLEVGTAAETITVEAAAAGVQTDSATMGEVIDTKKVVDMPLNGRFFLDLAMIVAGTVMPSTNNRTFLAVPTSGGALGLNAAGAREDQNNYLFDGINLSDMVQNQITLLPNVDMVQEFKVQTNSFSAEYGRNAGIIVNAVTKSGTNQIHGSAFEFVRNDVFDARNFFDLPRPVAKAQTGRDLPPFKRNIYGWSVGGPVVLPGYDGRNRTFFFQSFEGRRQRESDTFRTTVPTDAQRAAVTNPVVKKVLALIPAPNLAGAVNNFAGSASKNRDLDQVSGKIDHLITASDLVSGTYIFQRDQRVEPTSTGSHNLPGFGDFRPAHRQMLALKYTKTISPRLVNDFRAGLNRVHITFTASEHLNPQDFGMDIGRTDNFPDFRISGGPAFGGITGFPQGRGDTSFQYNDSLSWVRGVHSMKFGVEIRRFDNNNISTGLGTGGIIRFPSMAAFLAGTPNQTQFQSAEYDPAIRVSAYNGFFQDDWRVSPRLTLNLGIRYEFNGVPHEKYNRLSVFDFAKNQLVQAGTGGVDKIYAASYKDFGPRAGFSWDPVGHGKTVLRGGFGVYFDQPVTGIAANLAANPPLTIPITVTPDPVKLPVIDLARPYFFPGTVTPSPNATAGNFASAYVLQYNLNVQHEVWSTVLQAGYVGSQGRHLRVRRDANQGIAGVRPFSAFGPITLEESSSRSNYNGLWLSANRRVARGVTFGTFYTFSKSIDLNSVSGSQPQIQNANNLNAERGLSDFDARHRFSASAIYELPIHATGFAGRIVGGWSLSGIFNYQSGNPFSPIQPALQSGTLNVWDRPDIVPGPSLTVPNPSPTLWFNPLAFALNQRNKFGNAGRNILTAPSFKNLDIALLKNIRIYERVAVQFRAEAFDLANHANFGQPGNSFGSNTFGVISSTRSPRGDLGSSRQIELGLKLLF